jgi:L,D-transpeptidase ErfK/SrfK
LRRWVAASTAAIAVLTLGQAAVAAAGPDVYDSLLPGRLTGSVSPYIVKKGDSITAISTRYAVHPIRVYKPNREALKDGLEYNETIYIDQRRITPRFRPDVRGIVLNIPEAQVYLVEKGQLVSEYPVAVSTTDRPAPLGRTRVVGKAKHPTWHVPASIQKEMAEKGLEVKTKVPPGPENPLGSRWIGWADGTFGFHGTLVPSSIKRYASHGCVRFLRPHIEDLYDRVSVGTPVRVLYQPVLLAVDVKAIWLSVYPDVYETDYDFKGTVSTLAKQAGVSARIHWPTVEKAIREADGIVVDVAIGSVASPKPKPVATAQPIATPRPIAVPTASPTAVPTTEPAPAEPSVAPYAEPSLRVTPSSPDATP